jgi:hypothetical protein
VLQSKKIKVYVDFPKVGLGNMLLVWGKAAVFCKINDLHFITSSWWGLRWGALLRRESKKRIYYQYFKETSLLSSLFFILNKLFKKSIYNPELAPYKIEINNFFIFNKVNTNNDLFNVLRDHKPYLKLKLEESLHTRIKLILSKEEVSDISIHVRRGDFKNGNPITPISHFKKGIELIRKIANHNLSVTIFSDATFDELQPLLNLENIKIANKNPDIVDILLMSKSKILFLSQSSSFSYWAAFLSDSLIFIHTNDWQNKIGIECKESKYKEIRWDENKNIPSDIILRALDYK